LRNDIGDELDVLMKKLLSLPASGRMKAEHDSLVAKLTLDDAYEHFRGDIFLSTVTESGKLGIERP
jgi:separase